MRQRRIVWSLGTKCLWGSHFFSFFVSGGLIQIDFGSSNGFGMPFTNLSGLLDTITRSVYMRVRCIFGNAAGHRCFNCKSVVVTDAGVDLSPFTGCELTGDDPTDAQQEMYNEYDWQFVVPAAIWR